MTRIFTSMFLFCMFVATCTAKFSHTYKGTATDGKLACIANSDFTLANITAKGNCRQAFKCIMDNIPNQGQSILSSGAAILGFIPTVLLVLGSTNAEIIRIHARYPLLAFFLSITNINKRPDRPQAEHFRLKTGPRVYLGPYGVIQKRASRRLASPIGIGFVHAFAALGAAIVTWQTVEIGRYGVMSWACWTDFYPVMWIGMAVIHHVIVVVCMRLSLDIERATTISPPAIKGKPRPPPQIMTSTPSALAVWDLTTTDLKVKVRSAKFAKWSKAVADLVNNVNYLAGTAVFTSLTLVSGRVALQKLSAFGIITVAARIAVVWVLEDVEGEE